MTPEKLKEIEATAQEAFKNGTYNDKMYDWLQENRRVGYITGALSLQPELDTLQSENDRLRERVRELEEWISVDNPPEVGEFVLVYNTEGATLIGRLLNNGWAAIFLDGEKLMGELTALFWKNLPQPPSTDLLTKPADSTGGGEKEACKHALTYVDDDNFWKCQKCNEIVD